VTTPVAWRVRLRFRLLKKLLVDSPDHRFEVAGREVVLSCPTPDRQSPTVNGSS
jgi:hypothetical protein